MHYSVMSVLPISMRCAWLGRYEPTRPLQLSLHICLRLAAEGRVLMDPHSLSFSASDWLHS